MFSVWSELTERRSTRREILRAGGLSLCGLSTSRLAQLRATTTGPAERRQQNSCIFLFLFGGPSQIDLWDMKPDAPAEIRGEFQPIDTNVPGIQVCEHLPRLAQQMDKFCLLRSMTHHMNVHGPACSELFSGRPYFGAPTTDQATEQDWPSMSAMTSRFIPAQGPLPSSVVLPWYLQFPGQDRRIAGQSGGRMGEQFNALLVQGDAERHDFRIDGMHMHKSVPLDRIQQRRELLGHLQTPAGPRELTAGAIDEHSRFREQAYSMLQGRAGELLDLGRESTQMREQYGMTMVGQSLLMARRLVEAGVSLVTVNWEDETKIDGVNTCWDTHQNSFPKMKNLLCPIFDQAFPAFLEDLDQRGLLETTLVVAVGEFGRTPHMGQFSQSGNTQESGRDHWPSAFTALVAGGGVRGGQVYGATNPHGALVVDRPVSPADLSATILHHLGVDSSQTYMGELQELDYSLSDGRPVTDLG